MHRGTFLLNNSLYIWHRTDQCPPPPSPHFSTGQMPFLPPNQQCQSTEGKNCHVYHVISHHLKGFSRCILIVIWPIAFLSLVALDLASFPYRGVLQCLQSQYVFLQLFSVWTVKNLMLTSLKPAIRGGCGCVSIFDQLPSSWHSVTDDESEPWLF